MYNTRRPYPKSETKQPFTVREDLNVERLAILNIARFYNLILLVGVNISVKYRLHTVLIYNPELELWDLSWLEIPTQLWPQSPELVQGSVEISPLYRWIQWATMHVYKSERWIFFGLGILHEADQRFLQISVLLNTTAMFLRETNVGTLGISQEHTEAKPFFF